MTHEVTRHHLEQLIELSYEILLGNKTGFMQINLELRPPYIAFISPCIHIWWFASTINCTHGNVPGYSNGQTRRRSTRLKSTRMTSMKARIPFRSALPVAMTKGSPFISAVCCNKNLTTMVIIVKTMLCLWWMNYFHYHVPQQYLFLGLRRMAW